MTGPEKKFYASLKRNLPRWFWQRIEDSITAGLPDCLCLPRNCEPGTLENTEWVTIELKARPHTNVQIRASQIAWHVRAGGANSWILNLDPKLKTVAAWRYPFTYRLGRKHHVKITSDPIFIKPSVRQLCKTDFISKT